MLIMSKFRHKSATQFIALGSNSPAPSPTPTLNAINQKQNEHFNAGCHCVNTNPRSINEGWDVQCTSPPGYGPLVYSAATGRCYIRCRCIPPLEPEGWLAGFDPMNMAKEWSRYCLAGLVSDGSGDFKRSTSDGVCGDGQYCLANPDPSTSGLLFGASKASSGVCVPSPP